MRGLAWLLPPPFWPPSSCREVPARVASYCCRRHSSYLSWCLLVGVDSFLGHLHFAGLGRVTHPLTQFFPAPIRAGPAWPSPCSCGGGGTWHWWKVWAGSARPAAEGRGAAPPPWAGPGQHEAFTVALSMRAVRWPPSKWPPVALPACVSAPTRHVGPCHRSPPRGCRACQFFPF